MSNLDQARVATRSTETTRTALIKAATSVFAEYGYDGGSVRLITQRAMANQAAVNYHFGGKDGLYREVLIEATRAFEENAFLDPEELDSLSPEDALRRYLHQFLLPLVKRDRVSRYLRIFAWESVRPSEVFSAFVAHSPPRIFRFGGARRTALSAAGRLCGDRHIRDAVARPAADVLRARSRAAGAAALLAQI